MKPKVYTQKVVSFLMIAIFISPYMGISQIQRTMEPETQEFLQGTIVIKVKEGIGPFEKQKGNISFGISTLDEKVQQFAVSKLEKRFKHKPIPKNSGLPALDRIYRINFPESQNVSEVVKAFADDPNIEYAEAVPIGKFTVMPDDPMYGSQQHLPQIMAPEAWDVHKGEDGDEVVVAIVDSGTDWLHPDLTENCWQNLGEDADGDGVTLEFNDGVWERDPDDLNGVDDDGNGYVDDVIGWDFYEEVTIGDGSNPDPIWGQGPYEHGSHCAGIAAGVTNNGVGIASVSWNVKYMPVQTDDGNNTVLYGIDGVIYAAENGADIISNSWYHGYGYSQTENDVMQYAIGLGSIVCFGAANDNSDAIALPAGYPGVISVAAVNPDDTRASFSNYGIGIDIASPGVSILSTLTDNGYASWDGTSMATPMVAGLFALLKSYQPTWTNDQLIKQVIGTADNIDDLNPGYEKALGSGRINAYHALVDENVEVPQELRLEFLGLTVEDEDGDGSIAAGEKAFVSVRMRNYAHLVSDDNATFTISSLDPDIELINGTGTAMIPADSEFEVENIFEFKVAEGAKVHMSDFIMEVSSDMPVIYGSETEFGVVVAPSGFFVWEGTPDRPDYSGSYIRDFLIEREYPVLYSNAMLQSLYTQSIFPESLNGFDAVFLSFGNRNSGSVTLTDEMADVIIDYLENGGSVYIDGADPLGFDQPGNSQLLDLFGLASASDGSENPIDLLEGQAGAVTDGIVFSANTQANNAWIDRFTLSENGVAAFIESDYGIVAVQNIETDAHRTFCFSYAISELSDDGPVSSRYNLMAHILDHFGYPQGNGGVIVNFETDKTFGKPDFEVQFIDWSIPETDVEITGYAWDFNEDGIYDSYEQNPSWTYTRGGVFDVELIVFTASGSDTLIKRDLIAVKSGILVYEGKENENGYSGTFIYNYLQNHWYDEISYTNKLPVSLDGYDAVFLSFGNTGLRSTILTNQMSSAIFNYSLAGGNIYLEGGDAVHSLNQSNLWAFGMDNSENGEKNEINELTGMEGAITAGMEFSTTNQWSVRSIDSYNVYETLPGAKAAFSEGDYGIVAVEFDGSQVQGQKSFCMSYAIANLEENGGTNTREELLQRILNFFDVVTGDEELDHTPEYEISVYPNPTSNEITISGLPDHSVIKLTDLNGNLLMSDHTYREQITLNLSKLRNGIYLIRLNNEVRKIVKM